MLHSVSGEVDLIAVAATASVAEMDQVIDRIGALDGSGAHDVIDHPFD